MSAAMPAQPSYARFSEIVRHFAPGWFAAVMGSGVLAITTLTLSARWPLLAPLAWSLHYFNLLLFGVLAVPWLGRWLAHRELALATLKHPVQVNFYPTFSIAMLVIAARTAEWGLLPVTAEESLEPDHQYHRRYSLTGKSGGSQIDGIHLLFQSIIGL